MNQILAVIACGLLLLAVTRRNKVVGPDQKPLLPTPVRKIIGIICGLSGLAFVVAGIVALSLDTMSKGAIEFCGIHFDTAYVGMGLVFLGLVFWQLTINAYAGP